MAEYIRYDGGKALDEKGRLDIVGGGTATGGCTVVEIKVYDGTTIPYIDMPAGELWEAYLHGAVVGHSTTQNGEVIATLIEAAHVEEAYSFRSQMSGSTITFLATSKDQKPGVD